MQRYTLKSERATAENVRPFGRLIGIAAEVPLLMSWPGTDVYGAFPLLTDSDTEVLAVRVREGEMRVSMIERHYKHTQTYLPLDGRSFVMVLGPANRGAMPEWDRLSALRFEDSCGIALDVGIWHAFPFAVSIETRFAVILRKEAHLNTLAEPEVSGDAEGPDLHRRVLRDDVVVTVDDHVLVGHVALPAL